MNAASRELLRQNLLVQLNAVTPAALRVPALQVGAMAGGFDVLQAELAGELAYLADKKLVSTVEKPVSPENKHWRITADGRDYLAELGLA